MYHIVCICTKFVHHFTCGLTLTDGIGGERMDEISVCGAPGLEIQYLYHIIKYTHFSLYIYTYNHVYYMVVLPVQCDAYPVVPR